MPNLSHLSFPQMPLKIDHRSSDLEDRGGGGDRRGGGGGGLQRPRKQIPYLDLRREEEEEKKQVFFAFEEEAKHRTPKKHVWEEAL